MGEAPDDMAKQKQGQNNQSDDRPVAVSNPLPKSSLGSSFSLGVGSGYLIIHVVLRHFITSYVWVGP